MVAGGPGAVSLPDEVIAPFEALLSQSLEEVVASQAQQPREAFALVAARICGLDVQGTDARRIKATHAGAESADLKSRYLDSISSELQAAIEEAIEDVGEQHRISGKGSPKSPRDWQQALATALIKATTGRAVAPDTSKGNAKDQASLRSKAAAKMQAAHRGRETRSAIGLADPRASEELRALFRALDTDGDGRVTRKEWGRQLSQHREAVAHAFGGKTMDELGRVFKRLDADSSGDLSWEEFEGGAALALRKAMMSDEARMDLRMLFASIDVDGDGRVSGKEWGQAVTRNAPIMSHYFGGLTAAEIGRAFRRLDVDKSGDLSWDEFEAGVAYLDAATRLDHALSTEEGRRELRTLFDTIDSDGNGRISAKEWGQSVTRNADLMAKYFGGASLEAIGKTFRRLDVDGSGDLSWDEFVASRRLEAAVGGQHESLAEDDEGCMA
uniref:EF-hand domain-containing protein n=1 Tax=Haptolina brevifila TaxID=156173 RepID=A0A7S2I9M3_9EUKA|mmetsp:Transcript_63209/g.124941  ORF Transcript_63209/g.124941 Transcript_63209/m.124941 type:complete len:442 (+) Transcript_63209:134-1459(+)